MPPLHRVLLLALCAGAGAFAPPNGAGAGVVRASRAQHSRVSVPRVHALAMASEDEKDGFLSGIVKLFSPEKKEESAISKRQKEIDSSVDKILEGAPWVLGALLKPMVKAAGGMMAEAFAQSTQDIDSVLDALDGALSSDSRVSSSLGGQVAAGSPVGQSYNSVMVNGAARKMITLLVPVSGARGSGSARVQASIDGSGKVGDLQVIFNGPGVGQIQLSGRGGYGGGSDDIIDVDVVDV
ncbi:hypothetical protein T492DRAFT_1071570 [Pavlovales sp. CCMP2436]|nr:hypothetical protein T492DRAFT_1071570 [Pavlovales sp. CCMP2436]|mmetsp:Transcript_13411/g.34188  ORF Transcript_13411/g.34188 Transcript_13411/m.34188 type:complete len:239 (-) Transcript_13411:79-795(-)